MTYGVMGPAKYFGIGVRKAIYSPLCGHGFIPILGYWFAFTEGRSLLSTIALLLLPTCALTSASLLPPLCHNPGAAHDH